MHLFDDRNMPPFKADRATILRRVTEERVVARLWDRDGSLWHPSPATQARIRQRLGWLDLPDDGATMQAWAATIRAAYTDVLYVASGAAADFARLWRDRAPASGALRFALAETPAAIDAALTNREWQRTALVVAVAESTAPEQTALLQHVRTILAQRPPLAATQLTLIAREDADLDGWLDPALVPHRLPVTTDTGDRFGAFSALGLAPAALLGWNVAQLIDQARMMRQACMNDDLGRNPGVLLGATLGVLAQHRRDKLTLVAPPELMPLAHWLSGVTIGSLSKHGRGFVPLVDGAGGTNESYRHDRFGVRVIAPGDPAATIAAAADTHDPQLTLRLPTPDSVGATIFGWYVALATTAMIIGVNPFDEPDTEALHAYMHRLLLLPERIVVPMNTVREKAARARQSMIERASESYVALAVYQPPTEQVAAVADALRQALHAKSRLPVALVYPARDHAWATQLLHAGRQDGILVALASEAGLLLEGARLAADVRGWDMAGRRYAMIDPDHEALARQAVFERLFPDAR